MNNKIKSSFNFLTVGKAQESKEASEGFSRYVGYGSSFVKAVCPNKKDLDAIMGYESANEPEYVVDGDNGKEVHVTFIVETDPESCNGIDIKNRLMFTLRNKPAYNKDETKVQVIDKYGNYTWAAVEDAKNGKTLASNLKIDQKNYRMAADGEVDLVSFLKTYLCIPNILKYQNGVWVVGDNAEDGVIGLDKIKDYFKGDFSELKEALKIQPNNKVKLLYGVRTTDEGKQYQSVCNRGELILRNSANASAIEKAEKALANAKANGSYANVDYQVCELKEWTVEPTNLDNTEASSTDTDGMPW